MYVRILAGALIIEGNDYLLMKRADNKKIAPGVWGGVGGHSEPSELNDPRATCLREIYEETGIEEKSFETLDLKYIIITRNKEEITLLYFFVGHVATRDYEDKTEEGKLFWINKNDLLDRPMSFETRKVMEHYKKSGYKTNNIVVGTVSVIENERIMNLSSLDKYECIINQGRIKR